MRSTFLLSALFPFAVLAQQPDFPRQVDLFVGGEEVLHVPHVVKTAIDNSEIANVKTVGNDELLVIGAAPGQTTLRVWLKDAPAWIDVKVLVAKSVPVKSVAPVELLLKVGETRKLDCRGVIRVAVGDSDIADVKVVGSDTLLVRGAAEGATTLLWWAGANRTELLVRVTK